VPRSGLRQQALAWLLEALPARLVARAWQRWRERDKSGVRSAVLEWLRYAQEAL